MVGLINGHIHKNLTQNGEPHRSSWEHRRRTTGYLEINSSGFNPWISPPLPLKVMNKYTKTVCWQPKYNTEIQTESTHSVEPVVDEVLEVLAHTDLLHQLVLVAVHACQLTHMGKDVLQSVWQLKHTWYTIIILLLLYSYVLLGGPSVAGWIQKKMQICRYIHIPPPPPPQPSHPPTHTPTQPPLPFPPQNYYPQINIHTSSKNSATAKAKDPSHPACTHAHSLSLSS